jgi:high-affinity nickel-transport protein
VIEPSAAGDRGRPGLGARPGIVALAAHGTRGLKVRLVTIYAVIAAISVGAWCWALVAFHAEPSLRGIAVLIYGLGLRHAVDADHIAAIDNATRKLMQQNRRPVAVGFWFAIGHSAIVVLVTAAIVGATSLLARFQGLQHIGGRVGASVSSIFLFAIAAMNIVLFRPVLASFRKLRAGGVLVEEDLQLQLDRRGLLARIFRPLFRLVSRCWHMLFLGFLFGLGFDTATEIAVFSIPAEQAGQGLPVGSVAVFPLLFAAGMVLVDTTDGVMMPGAYEWAFVKPIRKICYNMTITLVSAVVAILVGSLEALGLLHDLLGSQGGRWLTVERLNANFNALGIVIIGSFVCAWSLSYLIYRAKRLDRLEAPAAPRHSEQAALPEAPFRGGRCGIVAVHGKRSLGRAVALAGRRPCSRPF